MKLLNILRTKLEKNDEYDLLYIKDLSLKTSLIERNLEVWGNEDRIFVIKPYSGELHLSDWLDDQIVISLLYHDLSGHYRNNLYFLMVYESETEFTDSLLWVFTEIEKNHRVCRKYIVKSIDDLERIPSLNERLGDEVDPFDFDTEFKNRLLTTGGEKEEGRILSEEIKELISWYLEKYEDTQDDRMQQQRNKIQEILGGETYEN